MVKLEQNYRSTSAILRAANNVIGPNPKLFPKTLYSELGEGEPVRIVDADNEEHEAERVVARIQSIRANGLSQDWKDFAVLYRANHQARIFEQALRKAQIPYKVSGGQSFFDRAEIKDLCAWFRLWINNDDDPAFLRAITTPKRGIGHTTLQNLGTFSSKYKLSLFAALFSFLAAASVLPAKAVGSLHEFGRYVNDLEFRARHTHGAEDARAFMLEWLKDIDYEKHLYDGEDSEKVAASRWTNVLEFCDWMSKRCGGQIDDTAGVSIASEKKSLLEVAQTIALLSTISEREQDQNVVTLSTLHAAKGLEWPHVMLIGVTEGLLPFKLGDDDNPTGRADGPMSEGILQRLQEERRADVRGHHACAALAGRELDQEAQEGPRDDRRAAQPLHRRDGVGDGNHQGRSARKAQGFAGGVRQEGHRHGRRRGRRDAMRRLAAPWCWPCPRCRACAIAGARPLPRHSPAEVSHQHLLGLWRAEFEGLAQGATFCWNKHPEPPESVRGAVNRNGERAQVAGDLDDGEFSLEESVNGVNISAIWLGDVVEGSCGREIRGSWKAEGDPRQLQFVLRKLSGL